MVTKDKILTRSTRCLRSLRSHLESLEHHAGEVRRHKGPETEEQKQDLALLLDEVTEMEEAFLLKVPDELKV